MSDQTTYPHVSLLKTRGKMSGFATKEVEKGEVYLINAQKETTLVSEYGHGETYADARKKALWWAKFLGWPITVSEKRAVVSYETNLVQVIAHSDHMEDELCTGSNS